MSNLDAEIEDLLSALRLKPREVWANETGRLEVAGRCAGSYGCGVGTGIANTKKPSDDFIENLTELVAAGVQIEHAIAALARRYESVNQMEQPLSKLIKVIRNPNATREEFGKALSDVASVSGSRYGSKEIMDAVLKGQLDRA